MMYSTLALLSHSCWLVFYASLSTPPTQDICRRDENCEQRSEENSTEELALEVITYVGVALSLIGIVATIITLLVFQ